MQLGQAVTRGILGPRWASAQALATHLAQNAVREGFVSVPNKVRRALDLPAEKTKKTKKKAAPTKKLGHKTASRAAESGALVRVVDDALQLPMRQERLVSFDVLDCSLGSGQHSGLILESAPYARVVSLDCDYAARYVARELAGQFGADRYRHFGNRASDARGMFGERSFDAIIADFGPSDDQLDDPSRGFLLHSDDGAGKLDMRYGPQLGTSAMEMLNHSTYHYLVESMIKYEMVGLPVASKFARNVCNKRPFTCSSQVLGLIQNIAGSFPAGGWWCSSSFKKTPLSLKLMLTLRCVVNNEFKELEAVLNDSMVMLRDDGRVAVVSKLPWEEKMIQSFAEQHPFALLTYKEKLSIADGGEVPDEVDRDHLRNDSILLDGAGGVDEEDEKELAVRRHSTLWVLSRSAQSTFRVKNAALSERQIVESGIRWVYGMHGGQTKGYPACNFSFERPDWKERRIAKRNMADPPFDPDDKHWK